MNDNLHPNQFGLFNDDHPALRKRTPAEMSPEEFRDDPNTVFHSSMHPFPEVGRPLIGSFHGLHAGTEQAATEVAEMRGNRNGISRNEPQTMYKINMQDLPLPRTGEGSVGQPMSDVDANQQFVTFMPHPVAYTNDVEDKGNLSVVFPKRFPYMLQGDFVGKALNEGTPVHPRTAAMYKKGNLDNYQTLTVNDAEKAVRPMSEDSLFPYHATSNSRIGPPTKRLASREELAQTIRENSYPLPHAREASFPYNDMTVRPTDNYLRDRILANMSLGATAAVRRKEEAPPGVPVEYSPVRQPLTLTRVSERGDVRRSRQFQ